MFKKFHLAPGQWQFFLEDKIILRQRLYAVVTFSLIAFLLIFAIVDRQGEPINIQPTKLNTPISVGGDSSLQVQMTSAQYNPDAHVAVFKFSATGIANDSVLTGDELKFSGKTSQGDGEIKVIPTLNNQWVVIVTDLDKTFGAIQIQANSNMPQKITTANNASSDFSSSSDSTTQTSPKAIFSVIQKKISRNYHLKDQSAKQVTLSSIESEKKQNQQNIKSIQQQISSANQLINFDNQQIQKLQQNTDSITQDEANKRNVTVDNLRNEINSTNRSLTDLNQKLSDANQETSSLNQKKSDVESGKFKFPDIQKATKIK
jgi:hypothetical protein